MRNFSLKALRHDECVAERPLFIIDSAFSSFQSEREISNLLFGTLQVQTVLDLNNE